MVSPADSFLEGAVGWEEALRERVGPGEEESDSVSMGSVSRAGSRGTGGARSPRPLEVHSEHETQLSVCLCGRSWVHNWGVVFRINWGPRSDGFQHMNLDPLFFLSCQELRRGVPSHPLFYFGCNSVLLMETTGPKKDYNMCTVTGWPQQRSSPQHGWVGETTSLQQMLYLLWASDSPL